jgi:hypothetical protein
VETVEDEGGRKLFARKFSSSTSGTLLDRYEAARRRDRVL